MKKKNISVSYLFMTHIGHRSSFDEHQHHGSDEISQLQIRRKEIGGRGATTYEPVVPTPVSHPYAKHHVSFTEERSLIPDRQDE